ncbi:MAG: DegV family protein [Actinomycetia bacterium]|nr:DegV family protein [Actinomycetes bacterium]
MSKIAIVTDSTADIPKDLIEKFKIKVVPLYVNFEDRSYLEDGLDITSKQFYEKLKVPDIFCEMWIEIIASFSFKSSL